MSGPIDHHATREDLLQQHGFGGWSDREVEQQFPRLTLEEIHNLDHEDVFVHMSEVEIDLEPVVPLGPETGAS
jgi:hypothetical protein